MVLERAVETAEETQEEDAGGCGEDPARKQIGCGVSVLGGCGKGAVRMRCECPVKMQRGCSEGAVGVL